MNAAPLLNILPTAKPAAKESTGMPAAPGEGSPLFGALLGRVKGRLAEGQTLEEIEKGLLAAFPVLLAPQAGRAPLPVQLDKGTFLADSGTPDGTSRTFLSGAEALRSLLAETGTGEEGVLPDNLQNAIQAQGRTRESVAALLAAARTPQTPGAVTAEAVSGAGGNPSGTQVTGGEGQDQRALNPALAHFVRNFATTDAPATAAGGQQVLIAQGHPAGKKGGKIPEHLHFVPLEGKNAARGSDPLFSVQSSAPPAAATARETVQSPADLLRSRFEHLVDTARTKTTGQTADSPTANAAGPGPVPAAEAGMAVTASAFAAKSGANGDAATLLQAGGRHPFGEGEGGPAERPAANLPRGESLLAGETSKSDRPSGNDQSPAELRLPSGRTLSEARVIDQIARQILPGRVKNGGQIQVRLEPEELGEVKLNLSVENNRVKAHLMTQHQQVQEVLERHLPRLRETLEQQGFKLDQLQVSIDAQTPEHQHFSRQQQQQTSQAVPWAGSLDEPSAEADGPQPPRPVSPSRGGLSLRI